MKSLSIGELHKLADVTRREIEGYRLLNKNVELGEAKAHLTEIENEIKRRKESQ